jgi:hypothetical protein
MASEGLETGRQRGDPVDNLPPNEEMLAQLPPEMLAKIGEIMQQQGGTVGLGAGGLQANARELIGMFWSLTHRGDERAERYISVQSKESRIGGLTIEQIALIAGGAAVGHAIATAPASGAAAGGTTAGGTTAGGTTAGGTFGSGAPFGAGGTLGGGGAAAGGAAAGAGTTAAGGGGASSFLSHPATNLGINVFTSFLDQRAAEKQNEANQRQREQQIAQALAQLSPEQIAQLTQEFLPEIAAITAPQAQAAQHNLNQRAAGAGLQGSPFTQTASAGLQGQVINQNAALAFQQAMGLAGQRAGAITGTPLISSVNTGSFGPSIQNSFNQFLQQQEILRQQQSAGAPFKFPGAPGTTDQVNTLPFGLPFRG